MDRAKVAREDDDGVAEVDDATLRVSQAAVVEDLEEECDELPRCLLDPIGYTCQSGVEKESTGTYSSMRTTQYGLRRTYSVNCPPSSCPTYPCEDTKSVRKYRRQMGTYRRRSNETGDGVLLRVLGGINPDHRVLRVEENFGQRLGE